MTADTKTTGTTGTSGITVMTGTTDSTDSTDSTGTTGTTGRRLWRTAVVAPGLLLIAVLMAACASPEEAFENHVARSKALMQQGRFDQAGVELRNAMRIDPKAAEPLYLAGVLGEEQNNLQSAFLHYRRATELDAGFLPAWSRMGMFMLLGGRLDEAEAIATRVLGAAPEDPAGRALRIGVLSAVGRTEEAIAAAEPLVAAHPAQRDAVALLAGLYVGKRDMAAAERVILKAIEVEPDNVQFRTMYARLARQQNKVDVAEQQLRELVRLVPGSRDHRLTLAVFLSGLDRLDDAEKVLRDSVAAEPRNDERMLQLVEFLRERRSPEASQRELAETIARRPDAFALQLRLAAGESAAGRQVEYERMLREIITKDTKGASATRARAALLEELARTGRRAEAETVIHTALARSMLDRDALTWRARFALNDRRYTDAITDLRTVLRDQPDGRETLELLARAYRANGQPELAVTLMRDAVERFPVRADLRLALGEQLRAERNFDEARKVIESAVKMDRGSPRSLASRFELQGTQGNWKEAQLTAEAIKEAAPERPLGYLRLAQALTAQKRFEPALKELSDAVTRFPQDQDSLLTFVGLALSQGRTALAQAKLEEVVGARPEAALPRVLLGEIMFASGNLPRAEALFREGLRLDPRFPSTYINLARVESAKGSMPAAIEVLQSGLRAMPNDPRLNVILAEAQMAGGQIEAAMVTLDIVLKQEPGNDIAANNLAALISATTTDPAQLARAEALARRFSTSSNASFLDTLGRIYYQQGRIAEALPLLARAVKIAPSSPVLRYHYGMALLKAGDATAGKAQLREAVSAKVEFRGIDEARQALRDG